MRKTVHFYRKYASCHIDLIVSHFYFILFVPKSQHLDNNYYVFNKILCKFSPLLPKTAYKSRFVQSYFLNLHYALYRRCIRVYEYKRPIDRFVRCVIRRTGRLAYGKIYKRVQLHRRERKRYRRFYNLRFQRHAGGRGNLPRPLLFGYYFSFINFYLPFLFATFICLFYLPIRILSACFSKRPSKTPT